MEHRLPKRGGCKGHEKEEEGREKENEGENVEGCCRRSKAVEPKPVRSMEPENDGVVHVQLCRWWPEQFRTRLVCSSLPQSSVLHSSSLQRIFASQFSGDRLRTLEIFPVCSFNGEKFPEGLRDVFVQLQGCSSCGGRCLCHNARHIRLL
ncbi:hypothetical protein BDW68DRAFT_18583 [Aspergillus falconensis]